jgi:micrococcal nuclease
MKNIQKKLQKKFIQLVSGLITLLLFAVVHQYILKLDPPTQPKPIDPQSISVIPITDLGPNVQVATVSKVTDGDTIELSTGQKIRYIGVNTPETKHPTKGLECFGKEASAKNKELVEGKEVLLTKDVSETDRYGRLLRFVYVQQASDSALFVNNYLVEQGFAHASSFPPDIAKNDDFNEAQRYAQQNNKGLWTACK